ncbi:MAG TPA: extracellular solute-binding protein [Anaerolineales bacterium]|nr:extracellular solute-binding protein [Anaerolineales bacterium]HMV96926.1 extracellular solute-binding protein [Anaerolineales bacterium]HMX75473.1 extracellular solute-binding protein [Anaerolineales bacterium]HMZ44365.1 extracellular solute-binding protein [Anaerolineales bacterium]HNA55660.1 extracellular solute-binding protein [Anaerolineales bacterium]
MKKNIFKLLAFLVLTSLLLTACGGGGAAPAEKAKVTIFVGFGTGTDPDQVTAQEALAKKFNESHTDIEVEFLIVPVEESTERYLAMVAGGNAPQLVGPHGISTIAKFKDQWEDVTPYIEKDKYDMSDFYGPSTTLNKYPDLNAGLPLGLYPSFIFYNKDAFDAAGLEYPTHDYADTSWNIDSMKEMALKMTLDANGNTPADSGFDPATIKQWGYADTWTDFRGQMTMFGADTKGRPTSDDYKTAQVNSAEWLFGAQWLHDGVFKDHFIPDAAGQGAIDAASGDPFGGGHVAMWYSHTWYMSEGLNDLPFKYDIAPLFYNQNGERISRIHADLFTMPKTAKNKDAAWEVMKWLVAPEQIVDVCKVYGCLPARQSSQEAYLNYMKERYPGIDYDVIFTAIDHLDNPNHESWVPEWGKVNDTLNNTQTTLYTDPEADVEALMNTTNEDVQKILDEYWASK